LDLWSSVQYIEITVGLHCISACCVADHTSDGLDMKVFTNVLPSCAEDKPLMKVSADDTSLPAALTSSTEPILFDSDGSEDTSFSQPLPDSSKDSKEHVMLLDTEDEASSLQVPCLIPESFVPSNSFLSENDGHQTSSASGIPVDSNIDVCNASSVTVDADVPNGSIQKPVESQPFDFVNDVMRSCSPNQSNKSTVLPRLHSGTTVKGSEPTAVEFDRMKSRGGRQKTGQTADNTDS